MPTKLQSIVADLRDDLSSEDTVLHADGSRRPRFEVFHGANSICSQKVRTVLAHHQIAYLSHPLSLYGGQTYIPNHVRLRMIGCDALGMPLMTTHEGSTSVTAGGCDPAVVPTLIDWETEKVIVDSKRICLYLDEQVPLSQRLCPAVSRERVRSRTTHRRQLAKLPDAKWPAARRGSASHDAPGR